MGNRGFSSGANTVNSGQQLRSSNRFGVPFNRFGRFGRGCWNCGFGFGGFGGSCWNCGFGFGRFGGWGWGFGWPWLGFWSWDPFWNSSWWGWPSSGYGYYGYPNINVYVSPDSGSSYQNYQNDNSTSPSEQNNQENLNGNWITPNGPSSSSAQNSADLAVPFLIYMKNGALYTVRDYWFADEELHLILTNGEEKSVELEQVDLSRTNTENAKSGVKFIFKSEPSISAPAQPDAEPGGPNAPVTAPTQQINAVPQPEART